MPSYTRFCCDKYCKIFYNFTAYDLTTLTMSVWCELVFYIFSLYGFLGFLLICLHLSEYYRVCSRIVSSCSTHGFIFWTCLCFVIHSVTFSCFDLGQLGKIWKSVNVIKWSHRLVLLSFPFKSSSSWLV